MLDGLRPCGTVTCDVEAEGFWVVGSASDASAGEGLVGVGLARGEDTGVGGGDARGGMRTLGAASSTAPCALVDVRGVSRVRIKARGAFGISPRRKWCKTGHALRQFPVHSVGTPPRGSAPTVLPVVISEATSDPERLYQHIGVLLPADPTVFARGSRT